MDALKKYKVEFKIKKFFNKDFNIINTTNDLLSVYVSDHNSLLQADLLLKEVDAVLNGEKTLGGWDTQSLYFARIDNVETKIYEDLFEWENNKNLTPNFILPTTDFREIVQAWKNFMEK